MNFWIPLFGLLGFCSLQADEVKKISLPLISDIQRADIYVMKLTEDPVGVLVLCPGCNGNGKDWIENPIWQDFARSNKLDLAGISFASDVSLLKSGKGYYYASQGSGKLLLDGLQKIYHREMPLVLYGFSGGAHFISGFVEWKPERVLVWCAYSAEWWAPPVQNELHPPGLVVCGEKDERYGASLIYFKQGRALGKPWLWLCAPETGHSIYPPAEEFIRNYFAAVLSQGNSNSPGQWVDIDLKTAVESDTVDKQPSITGWLPDPKLLGEWTEVHHP